MSFYWTIFALIVGFASGMLYQASRALEQEAIYRNACLMDGHSVDDCQRIFP